MNRLRVLLVALCLSLLVAAIYHGANYYEDQRVFSGANSPEYAFQRWMSKVYGKKQYSQHNEELIIRDFFNDKTGGALQLMQSKPLSKVI